MLTEPRQRTRTALVIGGTGKTGRRIASRLSAGGHRVRIGTRRSETPFDWEDPATWASALAGVDSVYVCYYPDLAVPGSVDAVEALTDLATRSDVQRVVLLSGRGEPEAQRAETAVQESGIEWTIVRCAWFNQNFSENYLLEPIVDGEVVLPAGDIPEPFVDAEDIADVAAAALTGDGHAGQVYELTGPRLLTFEDAIREISRATGREIRYQSISVPEYVEALRQEHVPEEFVGLLEYLFSEVLDGRNASIADGVQRALGREPRDFEHYVRETAATGVWDARR
jgi:uncharacterized protein YbjT (DUF2867 family)